MVEIFKRVWRNAKLLTFYSINFKVIKYSKILYFFANFVRKNKEKSDSL